MAVVVHVPCTHCVGALPLVGRLQTCASAWIADLRLPVRLENTPRQKPFPFKVMSRPRRLVSSLTVNRALLRDVHQLCTGRAAPSGRHRDTPWARLDTITRCPRVRASELCYKAVAWQRWSCSLTVLLLQSAPAWTGRFERTTSQSHHVVAAGTWQPKTSPCLGRGKQQHGCISSSYGEG